MHSFIHDAIDTFCVTTILSSAAGIGGARPHLVAPMVGALVTGGLVLGAWFDGGANEAEATLGAGLVGVAIALVFSRWLTWRSQR